jgi:predicted  nucleic acid-binding Zn-ribbon protein
LNRRHEQALETCQAGALRTADNLSRLQAEKQVLVSQLHVSAKESAHLRDELEAGKHEFTQYMEEIERSVNSSREHHKSEVARLIDDMKSAESMWRSVRHTLSSPLTP